MQLSLAPCVGLCLSLCLGLGCSTQRDQQRFAQPAQHAFMGGEARAQPVTLTLETERGQPLDTFTQGASVFVAGVEGQRYNLRLRNHSPRRVEAVVTVDGRDVVSGELGNYKKQHGYVIEPYGSVVIDGFRRSMYDVAAFRFARLASSYSAQRGSPEHVGVIGVAIFEQRTPRRREQALAPYYERTHERHAGADPFPEAPSAPKRSAATNDTEALASEGDRHAPAAPMGTAYGEAHQSTVREVNFKRRRRRRPDAFLTLYYDSYEGLRARGIIPRG